MTFLPANRSYPAPVFISPWSWNAIGPQVRGHVNTGPTSSSTSANTAVYVPFFLPRQYDLQRFWWANGATVGTDFLQAGIYSIAGDGTMECVVTTGRVLSAGTVNYLQYAGCAVASHVITSGSSSTDGTTFVTASVTLRARPGLMYALVFNNSKASAADAASSVATTSGAVAFTSRVSQLYGASTEGRVSMWTATPSADVTDTITITFPATATGAAWALVAFTNVDTATNHGIVQTSDDSGSSTTPLTTLGAFGSANNATFGANANLADTSTGPGAGFLELADVNYSTPTNCLQVQFRSDNDTTSDGVITSGQWGAIAAEIKSLGTTRALPPGNYYMALISSGTTATVFRNTAAIALDSTGIYTESTGVTLGLPLIPNPAAAGGGQLWLHGITNRASP